VALDVWVPTALQPEVDPPSRGLSLVGRPPRGLGIEQAAARADVAASRLQAAYPETNRNRRVTVAPLGEGRGLRVAVRPFLRPLSGAVLLVLWSRA
jgi:hypothetical protein